jgi:nucleoside-diphosphate-sugar epimerase
MSNLNVLLLGGHGKVALHLTPLLLARSWNVTSVIRNPAHESEILALAESDKVRGKLSVLVSSLDDVKTSADAAKIISQVDPDYVVWSAGAFYYQFLIPLRTTRREQRMLIDGLHRSRRQRRPFTYHRR